MEKKKRVYIEREMTKRIYTPMLTDYYVPDRVIGPWSGSLVVTWCLLQGSHSPVVKTDVSTNNYTNMF